MQAFSDTICALLSAPGLAAVSLIRISGPQSFLLAEARFSKAKKFHTSPSHTILHGLWQDRTGTALDEVLVYKFIAPHSYTGEDTVELSCHGNPHLVAKIMTDLLLDCRQAQPGEFTQRAYLNGKLDLIQAEAVHDLIVSGGSKATGTALQQLQGKLTQSLVEILNRIQSARIRIELAIDFSDQDLPLDLTDFASSLRGIIDTAQALAEKSSSGRFIREGIRICLAGAPNSGKSSLFNAFLQEDRALVSPRPGTTRDYLEEQVQLAGYTLIIYDTAGLRESGDEIEQMGISLTHKLIESSDLILFLHDPSSGTSLSGMEAIPGSKLINLVSKVDCLGWNRLPEPEEWQLYLQQNALPNSYIPVSSFLNGGLERLEEAILVRLALPRELPQGVLVTNGRQLAALQRSIEALLKAETAFLSDLGYEFVAFDLIEASSALQEILGTISTEEMLNSIFADFCIGK